MQTSGMYSSGLASAGMLGAIPGFNASMLPSVPMFNQERDNELKKRLNDHMMQNGVRQVDVARETGINNSSLSQWLRGKLDGHQARVPESIEKYLENFNSAKPRINSMHFSKLNSLKQPNNRLEDNSLFDQPEN